AVNVQSGTLLISSGGTDSGSMNVSAAALLDFQPFEGYTLSAGITGPGNVAVTGGTLTVNTPLNLTGSFSISGGQIVLNAGATFASGTGSTVTPSGGTIAGPGPLDMQGHYVLSAGTLAVTGTTTTDGGMNFSGTAPPFSAAPTSPTLPARRSRSAQAASSATSPSTSKTSPPSPMPA